MSVPRIEIVERQSHDMDGLALIDVKGAVWLTFSRPWWDLSAHFWWWLTNGTKKWIFLRHHRGYRVRVQAVLLSDRHVRLGQSTVTGAAEIATGTLHDEEEEK